MELLRPGQIIRFGRYEIQEHKRTSCDKEVWLGRERKLGFPVVVDVFFDNSSIMPNGLTVSEWEAQVLGRLGSHPNIAKVVEYWEEGDRAFMTSRYLSGGSLQDLIAETQASGTNLPLAKILQISLEIASGLAHVHGQRILHRDLQPRNVRFDEWGTVHLVDFDTAVGLDDPEVSDLSHRSVIDYMAPELLDVKDADERADLYSLGATMYEMATGCPAFAGTREEILAAHRADPPPIERADLPQALRALISCLLTPESDQRPASALDVVKRLEEIKATRDELEQLLTRDESTTLEFKSSLRVPVGPPDPHNKKSPKELERALEHEVLKSLAAFLNTAGGTLIVGMTDNKSVVGIEVDYPRVKESNDGWCRTFDDLVSCALGTAAMSCIHLQLEPWKGRTIAEIRCERRNEPTWFQDELFVRRMVSTEKLSTRNAVAWLNQRST